MNGPTFATATTNRLAPRPAPAAPRQAPPIRNPMLSDGDGQFGRILTYLRLHWLTILFAGTLLGSGLAYAAYTLMPPKYESYALFQVASIPSSVTGTDPSRSKTDFATYLKTQSSLFKYEFVYSAALRDSRLNELETIKKQKDPFKYFDEELLVESKEGSEIVRLSLRGDNPDDIRKIIDGIKDAYMKEVILKDKETKNELRVELQRAKSDLENLMKIKSARVEVPTSPIDPTKPGENLVPSVLPTNPGVEVPQAPSADADHIKRAKFPLLIQKVAKLESDIPQLKLKLAEREADLEQAKKTLKALLDMPIATDSLDAAKQDANYIEAMNLSAYFTREANFLAGTLTDPNSPRVEALRAKAESHKKEADQILTEKAKLFESNKRKPMFFEVNQTLNLATKDIALIKEQLKIAEFQLAQAKKDLAESPAPVGEKLTPQQKMNTLPTAVESDYMTHEKLYEKVTSQLIATEYDLKLPPRVRVIQSATAATQKDTKKQIIATCVAALLGYILIGALAVVYEMRVRKISSLAELKTVGTTPVVGVMPWLPNAETARDPIKRADLNESIDKLRAYVVQTWLSRGATTVTVTSPVGDEGKTFTAFGLASSLAQAGYRTLLVDFDLRKPTIHTYAGVQNDVGVCDLLRGDRDLREAIQTLPSGLCVLPSGSWSDEARQAAVGGRLETLMNRIKEPFDCVVLHSHALLTVAETVEVARRSEVVLLCAQYRDTRLSYVKRAAERIATMEIPYSGIVYLGATKNEALC